jgi:DeoR family transcriptional regulator, deoxyribose operon repressor
MTEKEKRTGEILKYLQIYSAATVNTLAEALHVSHMTVRRDLKELEEQEIIRTIHGGAVLNTVRQVNPRRSPEDIIYSLITEGSKQTKGKIAIGKKAASLLEPEDVVIIDAGSTTEMVARYIPEDIPLTIICYTFNVLLEVHQKRNCKIILAGGTYHENTMMFESPEGTSLIRRLRANKAFISAHGISDKLGLTCANQYELETKKTIIDSSDKKILVADSSKFGEVKSTHFAELSDFNIFITCGEIPKDYLKIIKTSKIELVLAS